jgi:hypothetical protein
LLFTSLANAQAPSKAFRVPFHTARSLILVSVTVDGTPKTLIFDTGAERTLVNSRDGNVERRVTFVLGSKAIGNFPIILTDLSGMNMEKVGADGVLGEDVLRGFKAVHIDFHAGMIELETK